MPGRITFVVGGWEKKKERRGESRVEVEVKEEGRK